MTSLFLLQTPWFTRDMQCLFQNRLYVKAENCEFHSTLVPFLGIIIVERGVSEDPEKVQALRDWPTPDWETVTVFPQIRKLL